MEKEAFTKRLNELRAQLDLHYTEFARQCKVSPRTFQNWAAGHSAPHELGRGPVIEHLEKMLKEREKDNKKDNKKNVLEYRFGVEGTDLTFQEEFPKETPCHACKKTARLAVTIRELGPGTQAGPPPDGDRFICNEHENTRSAFWLHDAAAFATYLCTADGCWEATTLWNQG